MNLKFALVFLEKWIIVLFAISNLQLCRVKDLELEALLTAKFCILFVIHGGTVKTVLLNNG